MTNQFTAQFVSITSSGSNRTTGVFEATLTDDDLIRGNTPGERAESDGLELFNGFTVFSGLTRRFEEGEVSTTVTFTDGSVLTDVSALTDRVSVSFTNTNVFLLDQAALVAAGKTLDDVSDVQVTAFVDHDLSWAELGFGDGPLTPPVPDPEPAPVVLMGTAGRDRLTGTDAGEILIGGDNNDRLTGGGGSDTFVFGADAGDGNRDRDIITDFDVLEDALVLEDGASIRRVIERNGDLILQLDGDRDSIVIRDADASLVADIVFAEGMFLG